MPRYRIHYQRGADRRTAEVEANSPAEAVIKFRHVGQALAGSCRGELLVTSVCCEDAGDQLAPAEVV